MGKDVVAGVPEAIASGPAVWIVRLAAHARSATQRSPGPSPRHMPGVDREKQTVESSAAETGRRACRFLALQGNAARTSPVGKRR
jgi:hypothetical protein